MPMSCNVTVGDVLVCFWPFGSHGSPEPIRNLSALCLVVSSYCLYRRQFLPAVPLCSLAIGGNGEISVITTVTHMMPVT